MHIINGLKTHWNAHADFASAFDTLQTTVETGTATDVAAQYAILSASRFFKKRHTNLLLITALQRDDVPVFKALLPNGNPNTCLSNLHKAQQTPVLCAAIELGSRNIARALAHMPDIDPYASSITTIDILECGTASSYGLPPAMMAERAGFTDVAHTLKQKSTVPSTITPKF